MRHAGNTLRVCQDVADIEHLVAKDGVLKMRKKKVCLQPNITDSIHSLCTWFNLDERSHILTSEQIDLIYSCRKTRTEIRPKVTHRNLSHNDLTIKCCIFVKK